MITHLKTMDKRLIVKDKPIWVDETKAANERKCKSTPKPGPGHRGQAVEPLAQVTHCLFFGVSAILVINFNMYM